MTFTSDAHMGSDVLLIPPLLLFWPLLFLQLLFIFPLPRPSLLGSHPLLLLLQGTCREKRC